MALSPLKKPTGIKNHSMAKIIFTSRYIRNASRAGNLVRACSVSPRVRMAQSDFLPDEAKTAGNTLCINEDFGKIWRKICKPDVRGEILNRL